MDNIKRKRLLTRSGQNDIEKFKKEKSDDDDEHEVNIKGDNQFEPKSLREADSFAQLVVLSEIPERILLKYNLKANTQSELLNNAHMTEFEEDVRYLKLNKIFACFACLATCLTLFRYF